jgi:hypothetical protein
MRYPAPGRSQKFRLVSKAHLIDTLQIFSEVGCSVFVSNPWRSNSESLKIEKIIQNSRNAS